MPNLKFEIQSAEVKPYAVVPTLSFSLQISNDAAQEEVFAAALKCQVMIEATRRNYDEETKEKLKELFGPPYRWEETLRTLFWTTLNIPVPRFTESTVVELAIPCSEDQALAAGKYFYAVAGGVVPLAFLFSGTLFYKDPGDNLQVSLVPWEKEAFYKLPASLWQQMMQIHFPESRWLRVNRSLYDRLVSYKATTAFPTLQSCFESVLEEALKNKTFGEKEFI